MKHKCKKCGNKLNEATMEYVLETRHMEKPKLVFENLHVFKCTVCPHYEIPESSKKDIELLKFQMVEEMKKMAPNDEIELDDNPTYQVNLSKLKDLKKMIHRWIS